MKKRGVLSLWKVILFVILGILGVTGVTLLSLYLMGRFDNPVIEPEDMSFVQALDEGDGYYNETLGQFEVSPNSAQSFKLKISSNTEGVTETKVTLSLLGGRVQDGYVSDGIISVPQEVYINKAFTVNLVSSFNENIQADWTVGGNSIITAKSSNVLLPTQTIKISVDVPVFDIDVNVTGGEQQGDVQEVVVGTTFTLDTLFTPENSKYLFSDETKEKQLFYSCKSTRISYDIKTNTFHADKVSGNDADPITVYTFSNSYYQKQILEMYAGNYDENNLETYVSLILRHFEQNPNSCVSKTINIKVLDVDVASVNVGVQNKTLNTFFDKKFVLTTKSANGDGSLDLTIKDSKGNSLNSMFSNVGIKIPKLDSTQDFKLVIEGGKIMKVVSKDGAYVITKEDYNAEIDYFNPENGTTYYLLPDTKPNSYSDYFWRLFASSLENADKDISFDVNFFFENEEGAFENFFKFTDEVSTKEEEKSFTFSVKNSSEEGIGWKSMESVNLTINYKENGDPSPAEFDMGAALNEIFETNVYQDTRYFIVDDGTFIEEEIKLFNCETNSKRYLNDYLGNPFEISGVDTATGVGLFEINGERLIANSSLNKTIKIVAATIKTDANGKPYDDEGKYLIVKLSGVKELTVESNLSIANMAPSFSFVDDAIVPNADKENQYYIPAVNKDDAGAEKVVVKFQLLLNNSEAADETKVINAFNVGNLKIVCLDENGKEKDNNHITLQGISLAETHGKTMRFEGSFNIEKSFFSANDAKAVEGIYTRLQLQFDDGVEVHKKDIKLLNDTVDHFFIYYQTPVSINGSYEASTVKPNDDGTYSSIDVTIKASGMAFEWTSGSGNVGEKGDSEHVMTSLNELFQFTLTDQFGNPIEKTSGIYKVKFEETPIEGTEKILSFNSTLDGIQNFLSTKGVKKSTTMTVYVVNERDEYVQVENEEGQKVNLTSHTFTFNVDSEGVTMVKYDPIKWASKEEKDEWDNDKTKSYLAVSPNKSAVTVEKYVMPEDVIGLNNIISVYTAEKVAGEPDPEPVGLVFKLNKSYMDQLSLKEKTDFLKMLTLTFANGTPSNAGESLDLYKDANITSLKVTAPFKEQSGTDLVLSVRDEAEMLFDITLTIRFLPTLSIENGFNMVYDEYSDYLVKNENMNAVFAGNEYDLDKYLKINSVRSGETTWKGLFNSGLQIDGYLDSESSLGKLNSGNIVSLVLDDVYNFTTYQCTIYIGAPTQFTLSIKVDLYLNPNFMVAQMSQDTPYLDLENGVSKAEENLSNVYSVYKLTEYLKAGKNLSGLEDLLTTTTADNKISLSFENISNEKYIAIDGLNFKFVDKAKLNLDLGQSVEQKFLVKKTSDGNAVTFNAVKISFVNNSLDPDNPSWAETKIEKSKAEGTEISYLIGFEGVDTNDILTKQNSAEKVKTVTYDGENYLLLTSFTQYDISKNYTLLGVSENGNLYKLSEGVAAAQINGYVTHGQDWFKVGKTLKDAVDNGNEIQIVITLNAFISKVGEKFVYYENTGNKFNTFTREKDGVNYVADFKDLIGDYKDEEKPYASLERNDIYQELTAAGTYKILHDSKPIASSAVPTADADSANEIGLYFDSEISNAYGGTQDSEIDISIVEDAAGYISGLASIEKENEDDPYKTVLKINHLDGNYTDAYIVLRMEIRKSGDHTDNFVYYYRIKVVPSFNLTEVVYPYAQDAEYLDVYSKAFDEVSKTYELKLEETFNSSNSKWTDGKRFASPDFGGTTLNADGEVLKARYLIKSVSVDGTAFEIEPYISDNNSLVFKPKDLNTDMTIVVTKTYYIEKTIDGNATIIDLIGSERDYTVKVNKYSYTHSLSVDDGEVLTSTNQVYDVDLQAGSTTESKLNANINLQVGEHESKVTEFYTYIKGAKADLEDALQTSGYIKSGTKVFEGKTDDAGNIVLDETTEKTLSDDLFVGWFENLEAFKNSIEKIVAENKPDQYKFTVDGKTYFIEIQAGKDISNYIGSEFFFLENIKDENGILKNKVLHLMPQADIQKDNKFEIGYYSSERLIFRVNLSVKGYFNIKYNNIEINEGKTYNLVGTGDSIFSDISVLEGSSKVIENFTVELKDGVAFTQGDKNINYSNLIKITPPTAAADGTIDWATTTVEFAHFVGDLTFAFTGKIEVKDVATPYSFDFYLVVRSSLNTEAVRTFNDPIERYGDLGFDTTIETIKSAFADIEASDNVSNFEFKDSTAENKNVITLVEKDVEERKTVSKELTIQYSFEGTDIFEFKVVYKFNVLPNVSLKTNYPNPSGTTQMTTEYISTTQKDVKSKFVSSEIANFFGSKAPFAEKERIEVTPLAKDPTKVTLNNETGLLNEVDFKTEIGETWTINVSSISNVKVKLSGNYTGEITPETENTNICSKVTGRPTINVAFEIIDMASSGQVFFTVIVNSVSITYQVEILAGSAYTVDPHAPNYKDNRETIYAEDLTNQEQTLFAENRILSYKLLSNMSKDLTFYLRFTKGEDRQVVKLSSSTAGEISNYDLGRSFTGFKYIGTYMSETAANNNDSALKYADSSVYETAPVITSRITVNYSGLSIKFTNTIQLKLVKLDEDGNLTTKENSTEINYQDVSEVKLEAADYDKTVSYRAFVEITDKISEAESVVSYIDLQSVYNFFLTIEFNVTGNADDPQNYTEVEIQARPDINSPYKLLDFTEFGFVNTRANKNYTEDDLRNSTGAFEAKIYGFEDIQVEYQVTENEKNRDVTLKDIENAGTQEQRLARSAGFVHNSLKNTETPEGIKYVTGLTPNPTQEINNGNENVYDNYIYIAGITENDKQVNYNLWANGCSNDGNYIMMKISYTVVFAGQTITKYHNILFKVVCDQNTTMYFKNLHEEAQGRTQSSNEIYNNQSVATNVLTPYKIENLSNETHFNLYSSENGQNASVVIANMYGSTSNSAKDFTYTYTENITNDKDATKYNDYQSFNDEMKDNTTYWTSAVDTPTIYTSINIGNDLQVKVPVLALGEKYFVIEFQNKFGFKGRFYFTLTSHLNPQIGEVASSTFTEASTFAFGSYYNNVTENTDGDYIIYEPITYQKQKDASGGTGDFANQIKFSIDTSELAETSTDSITITEIQFISSKNNETYTKTLENQALTVNNTKGDVSFDIWTETLGTGLDKAWKPAEQEEGKPVAFAELTRENLNEAQITVKLKLSNSTGYRFKYKLEYLTGSGTGENKGADVTMVQSYSTSSITQRPTYSTNKADGSVEQPANNVTLSGIDAYAFSNETAGIDQGGGYGKSELYSNVNILKVERVDFYLGAKWIGGSQTGQAKIESEKTEITTSSNLVTSKDVSFVNKENQKIENGNPYDENNAFKVPYIEGRLFGTTDELQNVTMKVTLVTTNEANEVTNRCERDMTVTIRREASVSNMFENTNLVDGASPVFKTRSSFSSSNVFNDTLEVKLAPNEEIEFIVTDAANKFVANDVVLSEDKQSIVSIKGKAPKIISLKNNETFSVTKYVGISASIQDLETNLDNDKNSYFYVYVTKYKGESFPIYYNGKKLDFRDLSNPGASTETQETSANSTSVEAKPSAIQEGFSTIQGYSADTSLKMNINSISELNSSNYKTETLYFLYKGDSEFVYQNAVAFNIYPNYTRASTDNNNQITVNDYIAAKNGNEKYYLLPLENWSDTIKLTSEVTDTKEKIQNAGISKFYLKVSPIIGGSAFIDENGLITTTTNFAVETHVMGVDVYMKVSGFDGNYEGDRGIKIGSFQIFLNPNNVPNIEVVVGDTGDTVETGNPPTGTMLLSSKTQGSTTNLITIPNGYKLYYGKSEAQDSKVLWTQSEITPQTVSSDTYSAMAGEIIDFDKILGDYARTNITETEGEVETQTTTIKPALSNITYHIVADKLGDEIAATPIWFNNLNTYSFNEKGLHTVTVVIHGKESGKTDKYYTLNLSILIYDDSVNQEENVAGTIGNSIGLTGEEDTSIWYEKGENGSITKLTDKTFTSNTSGLFTKEYLVVNGNNIKTVKKHFFVYDDAIIDKTISIRPLDGFNLAKLIENGENYNFYSENLEFVSNTISFTESEGTYKKGLCYYAVAKDGSNVTKITLDVKLISSVINDEALMLKDSVKGQAKYDAILSRIKQTLKIEGETLQEFTLEIRKPDGTLQELTAGNVDFNAENASTTFNPDEDTILVTYKKGAYNFYRFRFSFYTYADEKTIVFKASDTNSFALSEMAQTIRNAVNTAVNEDGTPKEDTTSQVSFYKLVGTTLRQYENVVVNGNYKDTYYVSVGENYYLINIVIYTKTVKLDLNETLEPLTLADLDADITNLFNPAAGTEIIYCDIETLTVLDKTKNIVEGSNGLVCVNDNYYEIVINFVPNSFALSMTDGTYGNINIWDKFVKDCLGITQDVTIAYYSEVPTEVSEPMTELVVTEADRTIFDLYIKITIGEETKTYPFHIVVYKTDLPQQTLNINNVRLSSVDRGTAVSVFNSTIIETINHGITQESDKILLDAEVKYYENIKSTVVDGDITLNYSILKPINYIKISDISESANFVIKIDSKIYDVVMTFA